MQRFMKTLLLLLLFASLSGCFKPLSLTTEKHYQINPGKLNISKSAVKTNKTLLVLQTQTGDSLKSSSMWYMEHPYQLAKFTRNSWVSPPAQQLTLLIASALQQSKKFHAVVTPPFVGDVSLRLSTTLLRLRQNFLTNPSEIQMAVIAQLANANTGHVIAEKQFNITIKASENNPYGGVIATNEATRLFLQRLTKFVIANVKS